MKKILPENWSEEYIEINGHKEYLLHLKAASDKPVLLYIHGGPGSSESCFSHIIEKEFSGAYTMVFYDQIGCGYSYLANKKVRPTLDMLKEDLLMTVLHLKQKYGKDKIGIVGHSFGSVLGMELAKEHPEHVLMYIGVNQVVDFYDNEVLGYKKAVEVAKANNDHKIINAIDNLGEYPTHEFDKTFQKKLGAFRRIQAKLGLAVDSMKLIKAYKNNPTYSGRLMFPLIKAMSINKLLFQEMWKLSLKGADCYEVPVYFILGEKDWQAPYEIAQEYLEKISAPVKKCFLIQNAGHFSAMDNYEQYQKAMKEIIG